jgi:hypothetical protein
VKVVGGYIHFTLLRSKDTLLMQIRGLFMPCEVLVKAIQQPNDSVP